MDIKLVSADSHVVEPPTVFQDYLDRRWRPDAPRLVPDRNGGECYAVPGSTRVIGLGLAAAAGFPRENLQETGIRFADIRPGAWQPPERLADQDLDGVTAEVLYPTVGLFLMRHVNQDLVAACMGAYNRWLRDFCAEDRDRLLGCGVVPVTAPEDGAEGLRNIRSAGLRGALLPLEPATGNYTSTEYDELWATAVDLGLPLSFHALPPAHRAPAAGPAAAAIVPAWEAQELLAGLVIGGVLHRWPDLRLVFAEFDAGWVPHFAQRLDHFFHAHYRWLKLDSNIDRPPSEYIRRSVRFTFQDDPVALRFIADTDLPAMWASDFPHAESTWPSSASVHEAASRCAPASRVQQVFADRVRDLYQLRLTQVVRSENAR